MKIGWVADPGNTDGTGIGGAELTALEFRTAAPDGIEVVPVRAHNLAALRDLDTVAVFNCALYPPELKDALEGKRVVRYWNDVAPHGDADTTRWLLANAVNVFCSPLHAERFPWWNGARQGFHLIPPPVDYRPFREAAGKAEGRHGTVSVSAWRGWGKVPHRVYRWAEETGTEVAFFGGGQCAPAGSTQVLYTEMPELLAAYERFVYLPVQLEPFCRLVAEADAAGCEVIANRLVGALYWLEHDRPALETATDDFWKLVVDG